MKKTFSFLAGVILMTISCTKQDQQEMAVGITEPEMADGRKCAANEVLERQIAENPARGKFLQDLEERTQKFKGGSFANRANVVLYVPVVVQIVHTNPGLVTDAQIASQIAVLNKDFSKTNTELSNANVYLAGYGLGNVPNCKIQFVLKQTVRKQTTKATFGSNDAVKKTAQGGSNPVNPAKWLNLWVCDLSGGLLGYAQFPGGSAATDGVVIDYQGFGTAAATTGYSLYAAFNLGRSATHEIGHWFNLRHIWGDARCGNDQVADTPLHDAANGGCPATTHKSKCTGKPLEQWMNYMDYTNDACMYMFSAGQKTRMDAAIDAARAAYVSTTP
ncbi:MAG: zinc metalloprotease [Ferruginibacter sp.]